MSQHLAISLGLMEAMVDPSPAPRRWHCFPSALSSLAHGLGILCNTASREKIFILVNTIKI